MSRIKCFWLEPTDQAEISFRRYRQSAKYLKDDNGNYVLKENDKGQKVCVEDPTYNGKCPGKYGYCNASVVIERLPYVDDSIGVSDEMKTDPRWPTKCEGCGREFDPDDVWQRNETHLYERQDTGELVTIREAPTGAMWNADWYKDFSGYKQRPDGIMLVVKTPDGDWCVDGPSSNGNGWERTGTVPDVTANPSILMSKYHGWLRNGWLEEC